MQAKRFFEDLNRYLADNKDAVLGSPKLTISTTELLKHLDIIHNKDAEIFDIELRVNEQGNVILVLRDSDSTIKESHWWLERYGNLVKTKGAGYQIEDKAEADEANA